MSRHDDLQQITRDRLRAVAAQRVVYAGDGARPGAGTPSDETSGGERSPSAERGVDARRTSTGWSAAEPAAGHAAGLRSSRRARHRDERPQPATAQGATRSTGSPPARWSLPISPGVAGQRADAVGEIGDRVDVGAEPEQRRVDEQLPRGRDADRVEVDAGDVVPRVRTQAPVAASGTEVDTRVVVPRLGAEAPSAEPPAEGDTKDVVTRVRAEALAAASAAYADTHGHPLDRAAGTTPRRRWSLSLRHAVVAGAAVTVLAAGVVVRVVVSVPDGPEPLLTSVSAGTAVAGDGTAAAEEATVEGGGAPAAGETSAAGIGPGVTGGAAAPVAPWGLAPGRAGTLPGEQPATGPPAGGASAGGGAGTVAGAGARAGAGAGAVVGTGAAPDGGGVVVHVVGQVGRPGVVQLPIGSRVADALAVAGGAIAGADLSAVNLARVVADGEQIVVPAPGEIVPPPAGGAAAGGSSAGAAPTGGPASGPGATGVLLDLNAAGLTELDGLPGIGPVLAQRILDWRAANGRFRHVEELGEVTGIGDALLGRLTPLVRV